MSIYRHTPSTAAVLAIWSRVRPRVTVEADSECWTVSDSLRRPRRMHRGESYSLALVSVLAEGRVLPEGTTLLRHTCDHPPCINPAHLVPGDDLANARDRKERGRNGVGWRNGKCFQGHDITRPENVYSRDTHGRGCRVCARLRERRRTSNAA